MGPTKRRFVLRHFDVENFIKTHISYPYTFYTWGWLLSVKNKTTWPGTFGHRSRETSHLIWEAPSRSLLSRHKAKRAICCHLSARMTLIELLATHLIGCVVKAPCCSPGCSSKPFSSWEVTVYPGAAGNAPKGCVHGRSSEMATRTSGQLSSSGEGDRELKPSLDCSISYF